MAAGLAAVASGSLVPATPSAGAGLLAGMTPAGWVMAGAAVAGIGSSLIGGSKAAKRAKKIGRRNAELIRETAEENLRRMQIARGQKVGAAKAGVYASNVQMSGSSQQYTQALDRQFISDMAWENRKARLEERLAKAGGQAAASTIQSSALTSAIGYVGQAAQSGLFSSSP